MRGQIIHIEPDPHGVVQRLLPWYVTRRLADDERAAVEAHLAGCEACRAELETERQWQHLSPGPQAPLDVEQGWAHMRAMLGDAAAPRGASTADAASGIRPSRRRRASALRLPWPPRGGGLSRAWAAPALLSVALLAALGTTLRPASSADYHALAAAPVDGATAVVRFRPDATEAEIRRSLNASGARLVDGPTVTDAYVVRLPREQYAAALEKLRRQPAVALVEALQGSAAP